jgi:8-oxo-dGTP pyrophosphatase MutT (NUDIX family)
MFCNNCGKEGHIFNQCKIPITSMGIVAYRLLNKTEPQYLMICRKDTLGFIDFMRGKYSLQNRDYIMNMFQQMTIIEKNKLLNKPFQEIWNELWGITKIKNNQYNSEENNSREKFMKLKNTGLLNEMIDESFRIHFHWVEPEWGFPKGRRDFCEEKDVVCAVREWSEETGYPTFILKTFNNLFPFEENFMGSNYKSYKHKYFLSYIDFEDSIKWRGSFQMEEVGQMEWKTLKESLECIRNYNIEKKQILLHIHNTITQYNSCEI